MSPTTTPKRILVTGGTGKTGRRVAAQLTSMGHEPVVASRGGKGGIPFDWHDATTFGRAAENVDAAYLVAPAGTFDLVPAMRPFLERLVQADVGRLVLLSAASLPMGGPMMGAVHAWLADNAPRWTVLRPSWFMQNFSEQQHRETIIQAGAIYSATGDGRVGWIDAGDIAAVATEMLIERNRVNGDMVLTGPRTLAYDEVAATISQAIGRPIEHRQLSVPQLVRRFEAAGMPPEYAQTLADMDAAIAAGDGDVVTSVVADVTARTAIDFKQFAESNCSAWRRT